MKQPYIEQLLFIPTGSYHAMGVRPYTTYVSGDTLHDLEAVTDGFRDLGTGNLAGIAGRILRPTTHTVGTHHIDNGWNEERFMFMMKVTFPNSNDYDDASVRVEYVSGYTDFAGDASYSGRIDPRMRMYINTVIHTREVVQNNHRHRRFIGANRFLQQHQGREHTSYALRPRDVVLAAGNLGLGSPVDSDFRGSLSCRPLFSTIRNELPSDYMSRMFKAYRLSMNSPNNQMEDMPGLMSEVASNTGDEANINDPFVTGLSRSTHLAEGMFFSYGELCQLYADVDRNAQVVPKVTLTRDIGFGVHSPGDTEQWTGSNNETLIATMVSTGVPALMVDSLLTQCSFMVSNDTVNGVPHFQWLAPPQSFMLGGEDLSQQMAYFEDHFLKETFRDITNNGLLTVSLRLHSDLVMTDTRMELAVDGGHVVPFCVPNFASSLITPVIGNRREQVDDMAAGVTSIFEAMSPSQLNAPDPNDFADAFQIGGRSLNDALGSRPSGGKGGWKL